MLIKTTIFNNTYNPLKIEDITSHILDKDKETISNVWKITESTFNRYIKLIRPFQEYSYINVISPIYDEYKGFIYFFESISFDDTRQENISLVTPIEASFKRKFMLNYLIDKCILYISKDFFEKNDLDYYIEFIIDLNDTDIYNQINKYFQNIGIITLNIENIRFYDNLNGWFLSSYLLKDDKHINKCSRMNEDFPGSIKCDHLYRKHQIKGGFIKNIFNSHGNILKLYKTGDTYKIYGKINYYTIRYLYDYLIDYYKKYNDNLINSKKERINSILEDRNRNLYDKFIDAKNEVYEVISELILPFFQIPIGFDVLFSFEVGTKYLLNMKVWTYIIFDMFEESSIDSTIDEEILNFNFLNKKYSIYPISYYYITDSSSVSFTFPLSFIINEPNNDKKIDVTIFDYVNYGDSTIELLDVYGSRINLPYKEIIYNYGQSTTKVFNFQINVKENNLINNKDNLFSIRFWYDNTNMTETIKINLIKEEVFGRLVLEDIFSYKNVNIVIDRPIIIDFKIYNKHKNTICEIIDYDVVVKYKSKQDLIEIPKDFYNIIIDSRNRIIGDNIEFGRLFINFNENILKYSGMELRVYFRLKYRNQRGEIKYTNYIINDYLEIVDFYIEDSLNNLSIVPKDRLYEFPIDIKINGGIIKNIFIEDNDKNNPEKIVFGKNIFISRENLPIIQGENSKFSMFFKLKNEGKYKIKVIYEVDRGDGEDFIIRDISFDCIDFDAELLSFKESFFVDNGIYHISLRYLEPKSESIIIKNNYRIPLKIRGIDVLIPKSSYDIANKSNINVEIRYTSIGESIKVNGFYDLSPNEEISILLDIKSLDFGYNMFFIKISLDIFGDIFLPVSTFTNNNINKNVYIVQYDNKIKSLKSIANTSSIIKYRFKNYGSDSGIIKTYKLGREKDNIDVREYFIVNPYSIGDLNVKFIPTSYGRKYGYIYNEIISQIEAQKIYQDDYTTEYKIHNPGILYSFIADVLLNKGVLFQTNKTFNYKHSDFIVELSNIGINIVDIIDIEFTQPDLVLSYKLTDTMVSDKQYLFVNFKDVMFDRFDIIIKYKDVKTNDMYKIIIPVEQKYTMKNKGLCINNTNFDFGYLHVNQILEDKIILFNNTNDKMIIKYDFTGSADIRTFNDFTFSLYPKGIIEIPIGIFPLTLGKKSGIIKINDDLSAYIRFDVVYDDFISIV